LSNDKSNKLSALGQELERSLKGLIKGLDAVEEVEVDGKKVKRPKYSLVDRMRVYDRALKLEAIKAKITDDEGSFFGQGAGDE